MEKSRKYSVGLAAWTLCWGLLSVISLLESILSITTDGKTPFGKAAKSVLWPEDKDARIQAVYFELTILFMLVFAIAMLCRNRAIAMIALAAGLAGQICRLIYWIKLDTKQKENWMDDVTFNKVVLIAISYGVGLLAMTMLLLAVIGLLCKSGAAKVFAVIATVFTTLAVIASIVYEIVYYSTPYRDLMKKEWLQDYASATYGLNTSIHTSDYVPMFFVVLLVTLWICAKLNEVREQEAANAPHPAVNPGYYATQAPAYAAPAVNPYAAPVAPVAPAPVQQPVYQAPVQEPVYQAPVQQPVYQAPVQEPVYQAPAQEPVYQAPVQEPVYQAPVQEPAAYAAAAADVVKESAAAVENTADSYASAAAETVNNYASAAAETVNNYASAATESVSDYAAAVENTADSYASAATEAVNDYAAAATESVTDYTATATEAVSDYAAAVDDAAAAVEDPLKTE